MRDVKILVAEMVGTMILILGGPGSAILAADKIGVAGVAAAFGLSLLIAAYTIGPISGCHINPAVTLAMWITRKVQSRNVPAYIIGQIVGAFAGAAVIFAIANGIDGFSSKDNFAGNAWGAKNGFYPVGSMIVVEIVFTALLVFVVLSTTTRKFTASQGGLVVGLTLTLIHLITIPVDNTSVNPVRSLATAVFQRGDALEQIWAFILFPLVGGVVGVLVWLAVDDARLEDTLLDNDALVAARDQMTKVADSVEGALDKVGDELS
ncbi:MAG TPA: aquaporin [Acidimicrobiales bacterium]|nr:aquaporin [Acidimicrobiales bacterium]